MNNYSVESYIKDIRRVVTEEKTQKAITERIKPLAERLAGDKSWIKEEYYEVDADQGFGLHLLHEENDHELAVFVIAWAPGKGLAPHNHKTWAVVAGIEGQEHETNYKRMDDGTKHGFANLKKTHEETLYPGKAVCCLPEDIHSVWNNGSELALSIHTYGKHLNFTGRSIFDIDAKTETPCVVKIQN
jgi:predicted metal-dependent enzyme (double-stranded beta helix superfamily)|tara:strand:+ start:305 stop:865 length:561 start_codon:yes stop_codon:yes gene_type:complete